MSLEASGVCGIDASGKIVREGKVLSEPEALTAWFEDLGLELTRIRLEAGPLCANVKQKIARFQRKRRNATLIGRFFCTARALVALREMF